MCREVRETVNERGNILGRSFSKELLPVRAFLSKRTKVVDEQGQISGGMLLLESAHTEAIRKEDD